MFPPFPRELARHYCLDLISLIQDSSSDAGLIRIAKESLERKNQGVMIGCLAGWNKMTGSRVLLFAVSGNGRKLVLPSEGYLSDGFVCPPIVLPEQISEALLEYDREIHILTDQINEISKNISDIGLSSEEKDKIQKEKSELIKKRTCLTDISLERVFSLYNFTCFDGKKINLKEIITKHEEKLPPTGTGDCCGPKLLNLAFEKNLEIISMDEVFFDMNQKGTVLSCDPCDSRCGYILPKILGLEIIYRDSQIIVVNKPSGLLSVPGRGEDKQDCVVNRVKNLFPGCIAQPSVHRLDMETSGLLVLAFTEEAHRNLSLQFEKGLVHKKYTALLDGILKGKGKSGLMELKFRLDVENRPHQIYDEQNGKTGVTEWINEGVEYYKNRKCSRITFIPHTGRTHQLRLAASDVHGFGIPIVGDSLYGNKENFDKNQRLLLHAQELDFYHPVSGKLMHFFCKSDF